MPDPAMHEITVMTKTVMLDAKIGSAYTKGKDCVLTFDWQASEVRAYLASGDASGAPLLSALAIGQEITLDDFVQ